MLLEYINEAMAKAVYDKLEDGSFAGKIPLCPGVLAFAETLLQVRAGIEIGLGGLADCKNQTRRYIAGNQKDQSEREDASAEESCRAWLDGGPAPAENS